jgi:hypothetical protein
LSRTEAPKNPIFTQAGRKEIKDSLQDICKKIEAKNIVEGRNCGIRFTGPQEARLYTASFCLILAIEKLEYETRSQEALEDIEAIVEEKAKARKVQSLKGNEKVTGALYGINQRTIEGLTDKIYDGLKSGEFDFQLSAVAEYLSGYENDNFGSVEINITDYKALNDFIQDPRIPKCTNRFL